MRGIQTLKKVNKIQNNLPDIKKERMKCGGGEGGGL